MILCSTCHFRISELSSDGGDKVMLSLMEALMFSKVTSGVIGHRLYFRPSQLSTGSNFQQARHGQSTCQRSCFSTSCEVKRTCSTYFGIANSHGCVGEQAGGHIEKSLILTAYFKLKMCTAFKITIFTFSEILVNG